MSLFGGKRIYLDWAASAPVSPVALRAFESAVRLSGNPSSPHKEGVAARGVLEDARATIAKLMEVKREGVVFTSGATEANNLALLGRVRALRARGVEPGEIHVLYLPSVHASLHEGIKALVSEGVLTEPLALKDGRIDLERLALQATPKTRLVLMDAVCGETGTIYDTRGVRNVLDAYVRKEDDERILLHVDASQAPLARPFDLTRLAADSVALDAGKVGGVRGIGVLARRAHVELAPLAYGGGQEQGLRPGTEPVALAAALAAALQKAEEGREAFVERAASLRARLRSYTESVEGIVIHQGREGVPHILNLSLPGRDTDYLVMLLDREGFAVSTKSACETDSETGSRAVLALTGDEERSRATLRISWGPTTRSRDLERFARALMRAVDFLDHSRV